MHIFPWIQSKRLFQIVSRIYSRSLCNQMSQWRLHYASSNNIRQDMEKILKSTKDGAASALFCQFSKGF